ncbi:hypothetical protein EDC18_103106 [Natranaerovirga pectinivora]|uniref:Uncharacterized protein n=1 Tax=Natranaerovirga pectinivora TaxID=682400 RepID=A0A4R3MQF1_9FIRM|nr:hypothetical protein [Natranaerovirga pectinivora]TCT15401.1 hypothetical protein EDC18_103106 [Natranaerovirga pectinivora]
MNFDYMLLFHLLFLTIIILSLYHFTIKAVHIQKYNFILVVESMLFSDVLKYKEKLQKEDIFSFHKYDIWRFIEKTKTVFI